MLLSKYMKELICWYKQTICIDPVIKVYEGTYLLIQTDNMHWSCYQSIWRNLFADTNRQHAFILLSKYMKELICWYKQTICIDPVIKVYEGTYLLIQTDNMHWSCYQSIWRNLFADTNRQYPLILLSKYMKELICWYKQTICIDPVIKVYEGTYFLIQTDNMHWSCYQSIWRNLFADTNRQYALILLSKYMKELICWYKQTTCIDPVIKVYEGTYLLIQTDNMHWSCYQSIWRNLFADTNRQHALILLSKYMKELISWYKQTISIDPVIKVYEGTYLLIQTDNMHWSCYQSIWRNLFPDTNRQYALILLSKYMKELICWYKQTICIDPVIKVYEGTYFLIQTDNMHWSCYQSIWRNLFADTNRQYALILLSKYMKELICWYKQTICIDPVIKVYEGTYLLIQTDNMHWSCYQSIWRNLFADTNRQYALILLSKYMKELICWYKQTICIDPVIKVYEGTYLLIQTDNMHWSCYQSIWRNLFADTNRQYALILLSKYMKELICWYKQTICIDPVIKVYEGTYLLIQTDNMHWSCYQSIWRNLFPDTNRQYALILLSKYMKELICWYKQTICIDPVIKVYEGTYFLIQTDNMHWSCYQSIWRDLFADTNRQYALILLSKYMKELISWYKQTICIDPVIKVYEGTYFLIQTDNMHWSCYQSIWRNLFPDTNRQYVLILLSKYMKELICWYKQTICIDPASIYWFLINTGSKIHLDQYLKSLFSFVGLYSRTMPSKNW